MGKIKSWNSRKLHIMGHSLVSRGLQHHIKGLFAIKKTQARTQEFPKGGGGVHVILYDEIQIFFYLTSHGGRGGPDRAKNCALTSVGIHATHRLIRLLVARKRYVFKLGLSTSFDLNYEILDFSPFPHTLDKEFIDSFSGLRQERYKLSSQPWQ